MQVLQAYTRTVATKGVRAEVRIVGCPYGEECVRGKTCLYPWQKYYVGHVSKYQLHGKNWILITMSIKIHRRQLMTLNETPVVHSTKHKSVASFIRIITITAITNADLPCTFSPPMALPEHHASAHAPRHPNTTCDTYCSTDVCQLQLIASAFLGLTLPVSSAILFTSAFGSPIVAGSSRTMTKIQALKSPGSAPKCHHKAPAGGSFRS